MSEHASVWSDDDANDWGDDDAIDSSIAGVGPVGDAEIDEYVRRYSRREPRDTATSVIINLESDDDDESLDGDVKPATKDEPEAVQDAPSDACVQAALARFGHTALRGLQGPALRSVFAGRDTMVLLPTGGGKSLCFQLPAVMQPGLVVVISPLLALMQDQVVALRRRKVRVEMLCSLVGAKEKRTVHERLQRDASFPGRADRIEILYTTPETLPTESLQATLKALDRRKMLAMFAIDEAHCISSWGHDFRPAYLKLGAIRDTFPQVPIMALTATATDRVRADIRAELKLRPDTTELMGDFNRANISYSVHNKDRLGDDVGALLAFIRRCHSGSVGIVYVHRRLDTEALVEELQRRDDTIRAAPYHAEVPLKQREQTLLDWLKGRIDIICATIAFGMGIDHPAVRFVVHWNMPKSMENLYQEAGRAGRDGHASHHVLLYSYDEYHRFQDLLRMAEEDMEKKERSGKRVNKKRVVTLRDRLERLEMVLNYATEKACRRKCQLEYFGQKVTEALCSGTCDYCSAHMLFEKLPALASHRPEANTYQLAPGEAPYKWRRQVRGIPSTVDEAQQAQGTPTPMEAVPRYTGVHTEVEMPRFDLTIGQALARALPTPRVDQNPGVFATPRPIQRTAPPRVPPPTTVAPPSPPHSWHRTFEQRVPAGVRSIADFIAATAHERTTTLRGWSAAERRSYDLQSSEEDEDEDDVKWIDAEQVKRESPPATARRAKRPRTSAKEIIVIDDSD